MLARGHLEVATTLSFRLKVGLPKSTPTTHKVRWPMPGYTVVETAPTVADYRHLRIVSGLSAKTEAAAEIALPNTWFGSMSSTEWKRLVWGELAATAAATLKSLISPCCFSIKERGWVELSREIYAISTGMWCYISPLDTRNSRVQKRTYSFRLTQLCALGSKGLLTSHHDLLSCTF